MRIVLIALALLALVFGSSAAVLASGEDAVKAPVKGAETDDEKDDEEEDSEASVQDEWLEPGVSTIEDLLRASSEAGLLLKPFRGQPAKVEWRALSEPSSSSPRPDPS